MEKFRFNNFPLFSHSLNSYRRETLPGGDPDHSPRNFHRENQENPEKKNNIGDLKKLQILDPISRNLKLSLHLSRNFRLRERKSYKTMYYLLKEMTSLNTTYWESIPKLESWLRYFIQKPDYIASNSWPLLLPHMRAQRPLGGLLMELLIAILKSDNIIFEKYRLLACYISSNINIHDASSVFRRIGFVNFIDFKLDNYNSTYTAFIEYANKDDLFKAESQLGNYKIKKKCIKVRIDYTPVEKVFLSVLNGFIELSQSEEKEIYFSLLEELFRHLSEYFCPKICELHDLFVMNGFTTNIQEKFTSLLIRLIQVKHISKKDFWTLCQVKKLSTCWLEVLAIAYQQLNESFPLEALFDLCYHNSEPFNQWGYEILSKEIEKDNTIISLLPLGYLSSNTTKIKASYWALKYLALIVNKTPEETFYNTLSIATPENSTILNWLIQIRSYNHYPVLYWKRSFVNHILQLWESPKYYFSYLSREIIDIILDFVTLESTVIEEMPERAASRLYTDLLWGKYPQTGLNLLKSIFPGNEISNGFLDSFNRMILTYPFDKSVNFNIDILYNLWKDNNTGPIIPKDLNESCWDYLYLNSDNVIRIKVLTIFNVPSTKIDAIIQDLVIYTGGNFIQFLFVPFLRVLKTKIELSPNDTQFIKQFFLKGISELIRNKIEKFNDQFFQWIINELRKEPEIGGVLLSVGLLDTLKAIVNIYSHRNDVITEALAFLLSYHKIYPLLINYYDTHDIAYSFQNILNINRTNILFDKAWELFEMVTDSFYFSLQMQKLGNLKKINKKKKKQKNI